MFARTKLVVPVLILALVPLAQADDSDVPDSKGKPTTYKAGSGKYAIWSDDAGWHIRMSAGKELTTFHYKIDVVDGKFVSLRIVDSLASKTPTPKGKKGPADGLGLDGLGAGKSLDITTKLGKGFESGFDLKLDGDATALKFSLMVNDKEAPELILIGSKGAHPKDATFELPAKPAKK